MDPRVSTEYGVVEGRAEDGSQVFRGIPYAAPPFGALRFHYPAPPESWSGVRDAGVSGPGAPQPVAGENDLDGIYANPPVQGDDCLTVDIWTPDSSASGLPVMVWIHGGGYLQGAGSTLAYSGRTFARDGVVHVGINYRLGIEGFIYLGDGTDNLGLRDQVFALEWVQRNIAAFGGDPTNVTIFGQSAGSIAVMQLLSMPMADGLYARAIASSGTPTVTIDPPEAMRWTKRLAKRLGVAPNREGFASVPPQVAVAQVMPFTIDFVNPLKHGSQSFQVSPFRAVHGTPSLPEAPLVAARTRPGVPLVTGTTRNEMVGFLKILGQLDSINPLLAWFFLRTLQTTRSIRTGYRNGPRHLTNPVALVEAAWTDFTGRMPTIRLVEAREARAGAHPAPTWLYEFRWENPNLPAGLGSSHALDTPFTRDDLDALLALGPLAEAMIGPNPPAELAQRMHAAWIAFAKTGDPGWPTYKLDRRQTMVFNTKSEVLDDAAAPERQAWAGHR
ncbi:MAG: hypothetical protein JWM76_4931 [Pseudonocardiales bacterium]|nr:hypothetical protein [Pseudonocardiales bacterium]